MSLTFAGGLNLGLFGQVHNHTPAVAAALCTRPVWYANGPARAGGERLGLKRMVRTAVCRVRPGVSHADYHGSIYSILDLKRQTRSALSLRRSAKRVFDRVRGALWCARGKVLLAVLRSVWGQPPAADCGAVHLDVPSKVVSFEPWVFAVLTRWARKLVAFFALLRGYFLSNFSSYPHECLH